MLKKIFKSHFFKSSAIHTSSSFLVSILSYLFNLMVARGLSLGEYGEYMSAISYFAIFTIPYTALMAIIIKKIGQMPVDQRSACFLSIKNYVFDNIKKQSLPIILLVALISIVLNQQANMSLSAIVFIIIMVALSLLGALYNSAFQAFKAFSLYGALMILNTVLKISLGVLVIFLMPKLNLIYLVMIVTSFAAFSLSKYIMKKKFVVKEIAISFKGIGFYLKKRTVLIPLLTLLGVTAMAHIDVVLVKKYFDSDQAGLYAALALLSKIILYFAGPLAVVSYAFFTGSESKKHSSKILLITTITFVLIGLVSFAVYYLFPGLIIQVIYGSKFFAIESYVYLAGIFGALYALVNLYSQYYISQGSYLGVISIFAALAQFISISIYHDNIVNIMKINIFICLVLFLIYFLAFIKQYLYNSFYAKK